MVFFFTSRGNSNYLQLTTTVQGLQLPAMHQLITTFYFPPFISPPQLSLIPQSMTSAYPSLVISFSPVDLSSACVHINCQHIAWPAVADAQVALAMFSAGAVPFTGRYCMLEVDLEQVRNYSSVHVQLCRHLTPISILLHHENCNRSEGNVQGLISVDRSSNGYSTAYSTPSHV